MSSSTSLPPSPSLPVPELAASLRDVTNSYKFYWLLAILEHLQEGGAAAVAVDDLLARMVAAVWYPSNYFRLSFGKQDQLGQAALALRDAAQTAANAPKAQVIEAVQVHMAGGSAVGHMIRRLDKYVVYRFLRPFFAAQLRSISDWEVNRRIVQLAAQSFEQATAPCLYRFVEGGRGIELHPRWADYLRANLAIVTGFCLWHLVAYLQRNNPNVPNIAGKLAEPNQRDLGTARRFWRAAIAGQGPLRCVYSGEVLDNVPSLDHFLPWSFVAHDLLWNITPTIRSVNSAKRDQLPDFATYFAPFAVQQYQAVQAVEQQVRGAALLEDYILLLKTPSVTALRDLAFDDFRRVLQETLAPQVQIAHSMGFAGGWSYARS